jgi:hypothetical protein
MSKRKTVDVEFVKTLVNNMLEHGAYDDDRHQQFRFGALTVLEEILHETGNYRGYGYLLQEQLLPTCRPGVNYLNGVPHPDFEERFADTDNSRRVYN